MTHDGCGEKCGESTTRFDLLGSLAKMLAALRAGTSSQQSVMTWKPMVTRSGRVLYRLRLSGRDIDVDGCGLSGVWKTPLAENAGRKIRLKRHPRYQEIDVQARSQCKCGTLECRLQPDFVEFLMGYPIGYTDSTPSVMP